MVKMNRDVPPDSRKNYATVVSYLKTLYVFGAKYLSDDACFVVVSSCDINGSGN